MSVSLIIDWADGKQEFVSLVGSKSADEVWRPLALDLGMKWIPLFPSHCLIEQENLGQVIDEVRCFKTALLEKFPDAWQWQESIGRMQDALQRLQVGSDWTAVVG